MTHPTDDLMLCIHCLERKSRRVTGDHVVTYAMGGSFVIDRVCRDCDSKHGAKADAGLHNHASIEQLRADLKIAGHSGAIPDPNAAAYRKPLVSTEDPNFRVMVTKNKRGELVTKIIPFISFEVVELGDRKMIRPATVYIDPTDIGEAEKLALRALADIGITGEEAADYARFFAATLVPTVGEHSFSTTIERKLGGHYDGLLKVAYELAWYWLGESWLDDPMAVAIRETLRGETPSTPLRGRVYDDPNVIVMPFGGDPRVLHVAFVAEFKGQLTIMMRIFDVFAVGIVVSANAARYTLPEKNGIVMHATQRKHEEITVKPVAGEVAWHHDPETSPIAEI